MTGGWGTPRKPVLDSIREYADDVRKRSREAGTTTNPNRTQVDEAVKRIAAFEKERPDVMTGRCADGYHEDCHGHILGMPCCCDCHTNTKETTDDR